MLRRNFFLAGALALALTGTAAPAQDSEAPASAPAAIPGSLTRMAKALQQPFECDLVLKVEAEDGSASGSGSMAFFTPRQFRFAFDFTASEGDGPGESIAMLLVADDAYLNIEADTPDGKQAFKISLDLFEQLADGALGDMAGGMNVNGWNPADIAEMLGGIQFEESEIEGGGTRVHTKLTELAGETLPVAVTIALDLDGETAFPRAFTVDAGDLAQASLTTSAVKFPEEMDEARFRYEPEGVAVMDLTPLVQMQLGSMMEDEDEF